MFCYRLPCCWLLYCKCKRVIKICMTLSLMSFTLWKHLTCGWLTQCPMATLVSLFQAVTPFCSQGSLDSFHLYYVTLTLFFRFPIFVFFFSFWLRTLYRKKSSWKWVLTEKNVGLQLSTQNLFKNYPYFHLNAKFNSISIKHILHVAHQKSIN